MPLTHRQEIEALATRGGWEFVTKSHHLTAEELTVANGDVVAVVASDTPDDEGEVVIPRNINLERFRKVRQVYFDHELEQHPVGSAKWIKCDGGKLVSKHFFSQSTELARAVGDLVKEGIYRCYSIGCMKKTRTLGEATGDELAARPEWTGKKIWRGNPLMIEYSVVGQAANPDCIALAVSKKWSKPTIDLLTGVSSNTRSTAAAITRQLLTDAADNGRMNGNDPINSLTRSQMLVRIARCIDQATKAIDRDAVVATVLKNLGY